MLYQTSLEVIPEMSDILYDFFRVHGLAHAFTRWALQKEVDQTSTEMMSMSYLTRARKFIVP